jgi:hypothetical protein
MREGGSARMREGDGSFNAKRGAVLELFVERPSLTESLENAP